MYTTPGSRTGKMLPIAAMCCLGLIGFLVAVTIVLALIPIYIPEKDVTVLSVPDDNGTLYAQYSADATADTSVSGSMDNTDAIAGVLGLDSNEGTVSEAYTEGTFDRRRRSIDDPREKRTLKVNILVVIKYAVKSNCNNGPCLTTLRSKVISKVQKVGNIANFPCQVRSVDADNSSVSKNFTVSAVFLGFVDASIARLGFGSVKTLVFVAAQNGPFNNPTTWVGGIIPFGTCTVVIPAGINVTLAFTTLEIPLELMEIYGTFSVGSGSSPFTFNYPTNVIAYPGAVIELLSSVKTLIVPSNSIITLHTGASFSSSGVVIQSSNSSGSNNSITIASASGPLTCGILPSGQILSFTAVTAIVVQSGGFTSGSTFLGGIPPTPQSCSASSSCNLYITTGCILTTSDLNGVLNMNFATITVPTGAILQLGTPGSAAGFKFMYPVALQVYGALAFVGISGAGIYIPSGSYLNFWSGSVFTSQVATFIQVFDPQTLTNMVRGYLTLSTGFTGPYYIIISTSGTISISTTTPGGTATTTSGTTHSTTTTTTESVTLTEDMTG